MFHVRAVILASLLTIACIIATNVPAAGTPLRAGGPFSGWWRVTITCTVSCEPTRPVSRIIGKAHLIQLKPGVYAGAIKSSRYTEAKVVGILVYPKKGIFLHTQYSTIRFGVSYAANHLARKMGGTGACRVSILGMSHPFVSTVTTTWTRLPATVAARQLVFHPANVAVRPALGLFPHCP